MNLAYVLFIGFDYKDFWEVFFHYSFHSVTAFVRSGVPTFLAFTNKNGQKRSCKGSLKRVRNGERLGKLDAQERSCDI